ncbi:ABC transporter permease [Dyadobacter psychrophilus]|uniref:MacB-like core domain-containing protein n=1 Tax=Dyadobacter psychrophilus TaxID=651661 RepID=A0A1T5DAX3_9BACT|nr:ABC transporter permease [Dyadobacter psychrophilus]SKB68932.1 MacB-like core domain-containing protein [Dyadobacter psychrophilus]
MKNLFSNHLKTGLRNIWRNRSTNAVSIFGLSIGLASGLLIFLLVSYLFSFNRYHAKADRTFWIVTDILEEQPQHLDVTPRPMGDVLRREYPFVESAVRLNNIFGAVISIPVSESEIRKSGPSKKFEESRNICFTEPEFFQVFDSKWLAGRPKRALAEPNTVVLSRKYAEKYFGTSQAIGKVLRFENKLNLTVTGVIENPPSSSQLRYDILISYASIPGFYNDPNMLSTWAEPSTMCWVALKKGAAAHELAKSLSDITHKYYNAADAKKYHFAVIPLSEMFHAPGFGGAPRPILYALIVIGICLVVASCVNFINITTAQAMRRSKEVGVRKSLGSSRRQLIGQFITEIALLCLIAFAIALVITQLNLPMLNGALSMLRADISIMDLLRPNALAWFVLMIVSVIILAGFYPSAIISGFNPVAALKGKLSSQKAGKVSVRKGLVVVQFVITQVFLIAVIVMSAQVKYLKSADLGFNREEILTVKIPGGNMTRQQTFSEQLGKIKGVEQVALGAEPPMSQMHASEPFSYNHRPEKEKFTIKLRIGDMNFAPLFGLKILAGQNFTSNDSTRNETLVNEAMVKQLGLANPGEILGKSITIWGKDKTIVGVVKNFNLDGLRAGIQPAAIFNDHQLNGMAAVKINSRSRSQTLGEIEKTWNATYPEHVYHADFLDDRIEQFYQTENILLGLIQVFSFIALVIGCLGLYGLVTFMAASRSKEIGVRKVLGASQAQLLWIFGREFATLLLIAFLLAAPLGWFFMNNWLAGYAYKVNLGPWVFGLTIGIVAMVTAVTIGFQSVKAAKMNPVRSLRDD